MLRPADVELVSLGDAGLVMTVEEDGLTFLANAQKKAREYASAAGLPALADDSGLVVRALGGRPGVHSARYGGAGLDARGRYQLLLSELEGEADRRAEFVCVLALARPGGPAAHVFMGRCEGRIGRHAAGEGGFGYDPVFILPDGRSMAEVSDDEKDLLSHRGRAVAELLAQFDLARFCTDAGTLTAG
ncbi:MAG: RdgB/HAM1 family non-canonical purine NTP pyrophosphatase [Candidatus Dormibacteraeota bacterium]|nr:RdgB/HAM1 family non-canonical purine NTP pyrophosphatase [Candidatus Dormibacteraeota bacterium]